jgi:hypothetical protein
MMAPLKQLIPTALKNRAREFYWHLKSDPAAVDYIFIHINKNGGTSIERAIRLPQRHLTVQEMKPEISEARWQKAFKFTIVRNPWGRIVSLFHYRLRNNQTGLEEAELTFEDWLKRTLVEQDPQYYDKPKMFLPQVDWLVDANGQIEMDFIGRFEQLSEDFDYIAKQLKTTAKLPHVNASKHRHYSTYYTDETAAIVRDWYAKDIAEFGYEFERP